MQMLPVYIKALGYNVGSTLMAWIFISNDDIIMNIDWVSGNVEIFMKAASQYFRILYSFILCS